MYRQKQQKEKKEERRKKTMTKGEADFNSVMMTQIEILLKDEISIN